MTTSPRQKLFNRISRLRKKLNGNMSTQDYDQTLTELEGILLTMLDQLEDAAEVKRLCVPISQRYLCVVTDVTTTNKLTINPNTGRVTLKIAALTTDDNARELVRFAGEAMKEPNLPPVTIRGRIKWRIADGSPTCLLTSENKKFKILL
jgi:hypothetical protein